MPATPAAMSATNRKLMLEQLNNRENHDKEPTC